MRTRQRLRIASLVCLGLGFLLLAAYLLLRILESADCYLYLGGRISPEWRGLLRFPVSLPLGVGIILFSVKKLLSLLTVSLLLTHSDPVAFQYDTESAKKGTKL